MILTISGWLLVFSVFSQKINSDKVPAKVLSAFKESFPDATKIKWVIEDKNNYEAEFKMHKQEQSVVYNTDGNWIETEIEIKKSELPESIRKTLKAQFPEYKIEEASLIEDVAHGKGFEVEIEKGEQTIEIRFSATGGIIDKKVEEEKKGDKD